MSYTENVHKTMKGEPTMKNQSIVVLSSIVLITLLCIPVFAQDLSQMKGDYLGKTPPRLTPEAFLELEGKYVQDVDISPDGKEIFFVESNNEWNDFMIFYTQQQDDGSWTEPVKAPFLGELDGGLRPYFSPDGQRLYFISKWPRDVWMSEKTSDGWATAVKLDSPINSDAIEHAAFETADKTLWFCSHREIPESKGGCDLYSAIMENGKYVKAVNIEALNTENHDCAAVLSPDGKYLLFHSNRPGGIGGADLYVAVKNDNGNWSEARNLGDKINTEGFEVIAHFSADGKYILYTRRQGIQAQEPSKVYWVSAEILDAVE
jgi:dipeptidyl aminopeptidase/acylaminoacyl peptidase